MEKFFSNFKGHSYYTTVNFPFMSSNVPSRPSYGLYISDMQDGTQTLSWLWICHKRLVDRLLSQDYKVNRLRNSFQKILLQVSKSDCKVSGSIRDLMNDSFPVQYIYTRDFVGFQNLHDYHFECYFNTIVAVCDWCHA